MKRACIAIVDATRARIYTYDRSADGDGDGVRSVFVGALHEALDLVNPGRRGHQTFTAGIKGSAAGGVTTDDHREAHTAELDRRFAREVVVEVDRIARERAFDRVLLVASPVMLGELRGVDDSLQRPELVVEYVARDLARLTSPQSHDQRAQRRSIAPRRALFAPR
jgi:protein required for attachment to host cells